MESWPADRFLQFLRRRSDPHAYQPNARAPHPQGAGHQQIRRRPVRQGRYGGSAFLPLYGAFSEEGRAPVKFKHTRRDSFHDTRQGALYHCKVGATASGKITALQLKSIGDIGAHADHSVFALKFAPAEIAEAALAPIPNIRMESYAVYTDRIPGCMMRGVGNSQFNFIFGRMVDGLAERLEMDLSSWQSRTSDTRGAPARIKPHGGAADSAVAHRMG